MTPPRERDAWSARAVRLVVPVAVLACVVAIVRTAWLCDDAFISLRTALNFLEGRGLTWNPGARVQVFTHPLWLFGLIGAHGLTGEPYYSTIGLSLVVSTLALVLVALLHRNGTSAGSLALALLALGTSKSFVDYSTSGLENPLTHLLVVLACAVFWNRPRDARTLAKLALLAALCASNRPDSILLILPLLAARAWHVGREEGARRVLVPLGLGFLPLFLWEAFSLFYFGSPWPNTAYAKLAAGIPSGEYLSRGASYLFGTIGADPLGLVLMLAGPVLAWLHREDRPVALAILLHVAYVLRIGGDFMVGRMWTPAILLSALVVARAASRLTPRTLAPCFALVVVAALVPPLSPWRAGSDYDVEAVESLGRLKPYRGVEDERGRYYAQTGLLARDRRGDLAHPWRSEAEKWRVEHARAGPEHALVIRLALGIFGYYAGPEAIIVDPFALADPVLARIPLIPQVRWRIGHMTRPLPAGYAWTLVSGENRIEDADLARYYGVLHSVVYGELTSTERLRNVVALTLGRYSELLQDYSRRVREMSTPLDYPTDAASVLAGEARLTPDAYEKLLRVMREGR